MYVCTECSARPETLNLDLQCPRSEHERFLLVCVCGGGGYFGVVFGSGGKGRRSLLVSCVPCARNNHKLSS